MTKLEQGKLSLHRRSQCRSGLRYTLCGNCGAGRCSIHTSSSHALVLCPLLLLTTVYERQARTWWIYYIVAKNLRRDVEPHKSSVEKFDHD